MRRPVLALLLALLAGLAPAADPVLDGVPAEARKLVIQAELYRRFGQIEKALAKVQAALDRAATYVEAHQLYQDIRLDQDEREGLLARYRARLRQKPGDALSLYLLARIVPDLNEKDSLFQAAVKADPKLGWAWYGLGNLYQAQKKWAESEADFRKAVEIAPDSAPFHHGLGYCLMEQGKDAEADKEYLAALEHAPDHVDSIINRSVIAMRAREYARAEALCRRALEVDPANPWAQNNLGKACFWQGKNAEALKAWQAAAGSPRYDAPEVAYLNMGFVYRKQDKPEQAAAAFRRAIEINPGFAYAHVQLAYTLYAQKSYADAWAEVALAEKLGYPPHAEFMKALTAAMPRPE